MKVQTGAVAAVRQNLIIGSLPDDERLRVARLLEPVELPAGSELARAGDVSDAIYFPVSGLASVVVRMANGSAVECGSIGREGWFSPELFGGRMPAGTEALQQIAGSALRMTVPAFDSALRESPVFASAVTRFRGLLFSAVAQTAACNRIHDMIARAARWLLLVAESLDRSELALTHQFLAEMLGASRSSVTETLARIERLGFIDASRAQIVLRDAAGLRRLACECEEVVAAAYALYRADLGLTEP